MAEIFNKDVNVLGDLSVSTDLGVTGDTTVVGLDVTGDTTAVAVSASSLQLRGGTPEAIATEIEYDLLDIGTWRSTSKRFSVGSQETTPEDLFFKPDGTKMYVAGRSGDDINEYSLSTAWDIDTATYVDRLPVNQSPSNESNPYGLFISPDGDNFYVTGSSQGQAIQFIMSTPWDITTGTYVREFVLVNATIASGRKTNINFSPDGTKMFVGGYTDDVVISYDLSVAWDVSTSTFVHEFSLLNIYNRDQEAYEVGEGDISNGYGARFSDDGTKLFICDGTYDAVWQLNMSTAWDISTLVFYSRSQRFSSISIAAGLFISEAEEKAFVITSTGDHVKELLIGGSVIRNKRGTSIGIDGGLSVSGESVFNKHLTITEGLDVGGYTARFRGGLESYGTTRLCESNGGTLELINNTTSANRGRILALTNVYWGTNGAQSDQHIGKAHEITLGRPYGGAKVTVAIGALQANSGGETIHNGVMEIDSRAQLLSHTGRIEMGGTLQVESNPDLEVLDIGSTMYFEDTFTEASSTDLDSHTPDTGTGWTKVLTYPSASNTRTLQAKGGLGYLQLSGSDQSNKGLMYTCDDRPSSKNYEVLLDIRKQDSSDDVFHIIIKYVDNDNYYFLTWSTSYNSCTLKKKIGGVIEHVKDVGQSYSFPSAVFGSTADEGGATLRLRFVNNTLIVFNGDATGEYFRGKFKVDSDFNDGDGGVFHKVGLAIGAINAGDTTDQVDEWRIDSFRVYNILDTDVLENNTINYIAKGRFGIGTSTPSEKLEVVGTIKATTIDADTYRNVPVMIIGNMDHATNVALTWYNLPFNALTESNTSGEEHFWVAPGAGRIRSIIMRNTSTGTTPTATTNLVRVVKNGTVLWTSSNAMIGGGASGMYSAFGLSDAAATFTTVDMIQIQFQANGFWYDTAVTILIELT